MQMNIAREWLRIVTVLVSSIVLLIGAAALADQNCDIQWDEVLHDTFNTDYRSVAGAVTPGTTINIRLRVAQSDLTSARVRLYDGRTRTESYVDMLWDGDFDQDPHTYDWWFAEFNVGSQPTVVYYFFELNDIGDGGCQPDQDFYVDDDIKFYGGGAGDISDEFDDSRSFQVTVYDPAFDVPAWMQQAIIYQIFPDRFRDGNPGNNTPPGRFFYDEGRTIYRSGQEAWNTPVCDFTAPGVCYENRTNNFYGGDLAGIIEKIEQGYFENLGVTALYLNPIFWSPSNHKYDTIDYFRIDPDFGEMEDFQLLISAAHAHGLKIILDGSFNHCSSDSPFFDAYSRFDAGGNLTSPEGVGTNDGSGACESVSSPYREWFTFFQKTDGECVGPSGPMSYVAWAGFMSLPKFVATHQGVRNLFFALGPSSAGPYWIGLGADGWRFDVGSELDPGLGSGQAIGFWEGMRQQVRQLNPEALLLGEVWGDTSHHLLGPEWDSTMNYRFRSALLSWLFTRCTGLGCAGDGSEFQDNDSNPWRESGPISLITPEQLHLRLMSIWEDYPPQAFKAMMNLEGSHDVNRIRYLLKKSNADSDTVAVRRLKEMWIFLFTYVGAPTLYYGDEVGLSQDAMWINGEWQDDPFNRTPFPWDDTPGHFSADTDDLLPFVRNMISFRQSVQALQDGDVSHGMVIDNDRMLYGYGRTSPGSCVLILLNRGGLTQSVIFAGLNLPPFSLEDGTMMVDLLTGNSTLVDGGQLSVQAESAWGAVMVPVSAIDQPAAPQQVRAVRAGTDIVVQWLPVTSDVNGGRELATLYSVHRGAVDHFDPDESNLIGTMAPPPFGSASGMIEYTAAGAAGTSGFYKVCGMNAYGNAGCSVAVTPIDATATPTVTATPTSTLTPTPTPTGTWQPSATPTVGELIVQLEMPDTVFHPGDICGLVAYIDNGGGAIDNAPFFVILDIGTGDYWFYPTWAQYPPNIDYKTIDVPMGEMEQQVIPEFFWPDTGAQELLNIVFWAAVLNEEMTALRSSLGQWTFGFGPP